MPALKHTILLLLSWMLVSTPVIAQTLPPSELDTKYTPNESSPFSKQRNKKGEYEVTEVTIRNAIKFAPTLLIRQKAAIFYERRIVEGLALNVGIGKAFGVDFLQNNYFTSYKTQTETTRMGPTTLLQNSEYYGSSLLLMAGMRFYFSGIAFDGGYFEFNYRRENLRYQLNPRVYNFRIEGSTIADFQMNNFNFGFGISNVTGSKKNMTHEFYMMFGIKNFLMTRYELVDNSFFTGQAGDYVYRRSPSTQQARIIPAIHIGYAFGFGF
jgi:hypothetical protein